MKVSVLHDRTGKIRAITQVDPHAKFGVTMIAPRGFAVTEVELPSELEQEPLHQLHASHRVDVKGRKLVLGAAAKSAKPKKRK